MSGAFVIAVFAWFASAIATYTGNAVATSLAALILLAPLLQPQLVTFALARHVARRSGFWRATVVGACIYVGTEWLLPKLFGDTIGHGFYASALMRQVADLAGAPGCTFLLVVGNACALEVMSSSGHRRAAALCLVAMLGALFAYGVVRERQLARTDGAFTVGVVQADLSQYDRLAAAQGTFGAVRSILDGHFALSREALRAGADVLVWPETVYPTTFGTPKSDDGASFDGEIAAFTNTAGVPLVFGAYDTDGANEFNGAVFLEPSSDGRLRFETYRKSRLFPLTERVPAVMDREWVRRWLPWMGTWQQGNGAAVVPLRLGDGRTVPVVPLICLDAVDPRLTLDAVRRGAQLIVTLSNDSWFAIGNGPRLHLVVSAFRSLETRRTQVRATNTGISAIISPTGELTAMAGVHARAALVASVRPEREATTLMLAWGDWFGPTALALGVLLLGSTLRRA